MWLIFTKSCGVISLSFVISIRFFFIYVIGKTKFQVKFQKVRLKIARHLMGTRDVKQFEECLQVGKQTSRKKSGVEKRRQRCLGSAGQRGGGG